MALHLCSFVYAFNGRIKDDQKLVKRLNSQALLKDSDFTYFVHGQRFGKWEAVAVAQLLLWFRICSVLTTK